MAGGTGNGGPANMRYGGGVVMSLALHAALAAGIIFAPQIFKPTFRELPTLGPIIATLEGSGGAPRASAGATRPVVAPLPATPAPPVKAAPAPTPARPAPSDDLTIPKPGKKAVPQKQVARRDDLRPDFSPVRRQTQPTSLGPPSPAPVGPPSALPAPGPVASVPGSQGNGGPIDVTRKGPGGTGGQGTGVDPLLYYFARIQDKVSGNWMPAAERGEIQVLVGIRLLNNGQVRDMTIESSSGDRAFDDAAIRALRQALPLPPFPAFVKETSMNLILKFTNKGVGG